jgi:cell division protein FtsL
MAIEVVFEKRINNATVYRDVDMVQRRQYYLLTSLAVIFVMGLLFYGWQQYRWLNLGYEIERLQKQRDDLLEYQRQLVLQRDSLGRDQRIDYIARTQLGMVIAAPGQIVTLTPDVPGAAPVTPDEAAAPLSASNLNARPITGEVKPAELCSESDSEHSTSGGSSAERCQEVR